MTPPKNPSDLLELLDSVMACPEFDDEESFMAFELYEDQRVENARLAPIHKALRKCVAALKCNKTFHRLGGIDDCEPCTALDELRVALEENK